MRHAAAVRDNFHVMPQVEAIISHPHSLVGRIEAFLQSFVMGGDAGGASVLVAPEGLNTWPPRTTPTPPRRVL